MFVYLKEINVVEGFFIRWGGGWGGESLLFPIAIDKSASSPYIARSYIEYLPEDIRISKVLERKRYTN